jgi:hypothetical protein
MKKLLYLILFASFSAFSQIPNQQLYDEAFEKLSNMLDGKRDLSFKEAVFTVENAYLQGTLDTAFVNKKIHFLKNLSIQVQKNGVLDYQERDKETVSKYASLFLVLKDTTKILDSNGEIFLHPPFSYDFEDVFGHQKWENMFVSKLLGTHTGNCHSLPYLYKILAEEIGVTAHLALAPNHTYIKHRSERDGWYNTELTSGIFPIDAWLMASGYIHLDAIRNGVYMKALDDKESIALCLVDLALGYQTHELYDLDFVMKCAYKALEYFPNYISAMMLITEAKGKMIENILYSKGKDFSQARQYPETREILEEVRQDLVKIHELGYRQMPEEMYLDWLVSLYHERDKYQNKKINTFNPKTD